MFDWLAHQQRIAAAKRLNQCEDCGLLRETRIFKNVRRCRECEDNLVKHLKQ